MNAPAQVLLVEDDESVMRLLERWFSQAGYDVVSCPRFLDARHFLAAHTPDVLVTDVRLGEYNGLHLVMLAKGSKPESVAIVVSGFDDSVMRDEAQRAGAVFLLKPLDREELLKHARGEGPTQG